MLWDADAGQQREAVSLNVAGDQDCCDFSAGLVNHNC